MKELILVVLLGALVFLLYYLSKKIKYTVKTNIKEEPKDHDSMSFDLTSLFASVTEESGLDSLFSQ